MIVRLDDARVAFYRRQLQSGHVPAAFALGIIDVRLPAVANGGASWDEHWCLAQYILDGHHKVAASAAEGLPLRMLVFMTRDESTATEEQLDRTVALLSGT